MDGFHVERTAEDEVNALPAAQIGQPVLGEHAFHSNHEIVPKRSDRPQEIFRAAGKIPMQENIAFGIENAEVHFSGMKIDSPVVFVRLGVESHEASFGDRSRAYPKGVRPR
jgi:hypothetical protein